MKKKLLYISLITLVIALAVFIVNYFFFHFVTDDGISLTWHPEPGKPFVTDLIGQLGVLFIWTSAMSLISAYVFFGDDKGKKE